MYTALLLKLKYSNQITINRSLIMYIVIFSHFFSIIQKTIQKFQKSLLEYTENQTKFFIEKTNIGLYIIY